MKTMKIIEEQMIRLLKSSGSELIEGLKFAVDKKKNALDSRLFNTAIRDRAELEWSTEEVEVVPFKDLERKGLIDVEDSEEIEEDDADLLDELIAEAKQQLEIDRNRKVIRKEGKMKRKIYYSTRGKF
jgi:hypothetical protein